MSDPYQVLGLERTADEAAIRRRYLELVRRHPPDREPERFARIREAYDELRDPVKRMKSLLFHLKPDDSLEAVLADARSRLRQARLSTELLRRLAERT